jgi:hypothetical protein
VAKTKRVGRGLAGVSMESLEAELVRRQRAVKGLLKRYENSAGKTARLAAEIESLGGSVDGRMIAGGRGRRSRAKNDMSLTEALVGVLKGKEMSVTDAAEAVRASGYTSNAANFRTMVNQALLKGNQFKKVARGVYTAK